MRRLSNLIHKLTGFYIAASIIGVFGALCFAVGVAASTLQAMAMIEAAR